MPETESFKVYGDGVWCGARIFSFESMPGLGVPYIDRSTALKVLCGLENGANVCFFTIPSVPFRDAF